MKRERITWSGYKYAPESIKATCNGKKIDAQQNCIAMQICCGNTAGAIEEIKRQYRKGNKKEKRYTYAFFGKGTRQFYYIAYLNFTESADIAERLYNYKELKHHLQDNPFEIITESGHITPDGATTPEINKEVVTIDFSRFLKLRIA